jgi:hypothetical protein
MMPVAVRPTSSAAEASWKGDGKQMQMDKNDHQLLELLSRAIKDFEKIEDDPKTMNFIARRLGNIVKHMKDLRDDLRPRGNCNGSVDENGVAERPYRASPPGMH